MPDTASQDERDDRPLVYPGQVLTSPSTDNVTDKGYVWKKSSLFRKSRTAEAQQLQGRDMITVETVGETTLPSSTSIEMSGTVKGANKWAQIGPDAATKLLQALTATRLHAAFQNPPTDSCFPAQTVVLVAEIPNPSQSQDGLDLPPKTCLDLIDLNPGVGDFLSVASLHKGVSIPDPASPASCEAFVDIQQGTNLTVHYVCFLPSGDAHEWLSTYYKDFLAEKFRDGKLKVHGHSRLTV